MEKYEIATAIVYPRKSRPRKVTSESEEHKIENLTSSDGRIPHIRLSSNTKGICIATPIFSSKCSFFIVFGALKTRLELKLNVSITFRKMRVKNSPLSKIRTIGRRYLKMRGWPFNKDTSSACSFFRRSRLSQNIFVRSKECQKRL